MSEEKTVEGLTAELAKANEDLTAARKVISDGEAGTTLEDAKKYRQRAQEAEEQLKEAEEKQEKIRTAELEKKEEWKKLADERQAKIDELNPQVEESGTYKKEKRETLLKLIPEKDREIYEGLSLTNLEAHVAKLGKGTVPGVSNISPGIQEAGGYETPKEAAEAYARGEITHKDYKKYRRAFLTSGKA